MNRPNWSRRDLLRRGVTVGVTIRKINPFAYRFECSHSAVTARESFEAAEAAEAGDELDGDG